MRVAKYLVTVCGVFALAQSASAATFTETDDFPNGSVAPPNGYAVGTFDQGANSVSGSLSAYCAPSDCNPSNGFDGQDSFLIEVPMAGILSRIGFSAVNYTGPSGFVVSLSARNSSGQLFQENFDITSPFSFVTSLAAGQYGFSVFGQRADDVGDYSFDYTVDFDVDPSSSTAVPEPATWASMIVGLGVIGGAIRRRRAKSDVRVAVA